MRHIFQPYPIVPQEAPEFSFTPITLFSQAQKPVSELRLPYKTTQETIDVNVMPHAEHETSITRVESAEIIPDTLSHTSNQDTVLDTSLQTEINLFSGLDEFESPSITTHTETSEASERVIIINYNKINDTTNSWMFWLLLGSFMLFSWIRISYGKQLESLFRAFFNYGFAVKSLQQNNEFSNRFSTFLSVLFGINIGLFAFQIAQEYIHFETTGIESLAISIGLGTAISIIYFIKGFLFNILGLLFNEFEYSEEYIQNVHIFNRISGILLFPIIISIAFVSPEIIQNKTLIMIGLALVIIMYFFRLFRGMQISIRSNVSILYMFLYFCILELLPILLLLKIGVIVSDYFIYV